MFPSIGGYAAIFNSGIDDYFLPGCFDESLRRSVPIVATIAHLPGLTLAQNVEAWEDDLGLRVKIQPDDSHHSRLLIDALRANRFRGMSFTYRAWPDAIRTFAGRDGRIYREVRECLVFEVCVTEWPLNSLACCRLVGEPIWKPDPKAANKLAALCYQVQERDGFGVPCPQSLEESEYECCV
jgi:HK97 family phage prohead protease